MNKLKSISEAISRIKSGSVIGIGGNTLHRAPMALVREIARQGISNLEIIKTAGGMDVDLLCFAGCVKSVDAGYVSYESKYGLASHYRRAVQEGVVKANEHACYTVISALRAAQAGIPFMPVKGLVGSDLIARNDYFTRIADPFSGDMVTVVQAIAPDVSILHVHEADEMGNAIIEPPRYEDILFAKSSKSLIISAERIVPLSHIEHHAKDALIPHFLVSAVVHLEKGAAPCSCYPLYNINEKEIESFIALKEREELSGWLKSFGHADNRGI